MRQLFEGSRQALFQAFGSLVSRVLMAAVFIPFGVKHIKDFHAAVSFAAGRHLPMPPLLVSTSIFCEAGLGLALLIGLRTRWIAAGLILYCALWSLLYHNFWAMPYELYAAERIMFFKNMAIIGGLLVIAMHGPGRFSADFLLASWRRPAPHLAVIGDQDNATPARNRAA